jgi:hypothetical protein
MRPVSSNVCFCVRCRHDEFEDETPGWDFHLTVREAEPPKRPSVLETQQKSVDAVHLKETSQNYVNEESAAPRAVVGEQVVGKKEEGEGGEVKSGGESNRLSNGIDPHLEAATAPVAPTVMTNHSPRSSALQESRLSTLSNDSTTTPVSIPNGLLEERTSAGEESSMEPVADESSLRSRHESAKSITEETRELDEYLNRSSLTNVLTDNQIVSIEAGAREGFERVGSGTGGVEEEEEEGRGAREVRIHYMCTYVCGVCMHAWPEGGLLCAGQYHVHAHAC